MLPTQIGQHMSSIASTACGRPDNKARGSSEAPLYERDPEAWNAYLAEGNAKQARKRVSADAILRDAQGRILLVDPRYKLGGHGIFKTVTRNNLAQVANSGTVEAVAGAGWFGPGT